MPPSARCDFNSPDKGTDFCGWRDPLRHRVLKIISLMIILAKWNDIQLVSVQLMPFAFLFRDQTTFGFVKAAERGWTELEETCPTVTKVRKLSWCLFRDYWFIMRPCYIKLDLHNERGGFTKSNNSPFGGHVPESSKWLRGKVAEEETSNAGGNFWEGGLPSVRDGHLFQHGNYKVTAALRLAMAPPNVI